MTLESFFYRSNKAEKDYCLQNTIAAVRYGYKIATKYEKGKQMDEKGKETAVNMEYDGSPPAGMAIAGYGDCTEYAVPGVFHVGQPN